VQINTGKDEWKLNVKQQSNHSRVLKFNVQKWTGCFVMFSVITNIYNKKTKGPTFMGLFTATGKLKKFFFLQLEMFDLCTMGDTAHIDTIFKFLLWFSCYKRL